MKIFLGASGPYDRDRIENIRIVLQGFGTVFVGPADIDNYECGKMKASEFMKAIFEEIKKSDKCVFYYNSKSTGMGAEAGYAKALGKKIIVLLSDKTSISRSLEGISDAIVTFKKVEELKEKLKKELTC
ncbi:MAG: nucleoside 2-deoxyribosyltransferase [Candidatus Nanoarchaeia archaeon]|nr:nucleoside 2-deoxyribosyltransferase [Candidatus Nanoarchaeia archaeon]MDD5239607.1 nucleoside 2-deoxyribosyltransferase [Candidatus Nanoarchaeia archaeon]